MAKGNMLLGYARGSVGDVVFSRLNGQQVQKARNRSPRNPMTVAQMTQRSLFIDAVKFYQMAAAKFFTFAFENKGVKESDYNAFMRENTKNGVNISPDAFYNRNYPALGNWILSRGSLTSFDVFSSSNTFYARTGYFLGEATADEITTVGALSTFLLTLSRYQPGDMLTYVNYGFDKDETAQVPSISPATDKYHSFFIYKQFLLDTSSSEPLSKFNLGVEKDVLTGELLLRSSGDIFDESYEAACLILTRNGANGILASDSRGVFSGAYAEALAAARNEFYIQEVVTAWKASAEAILDPRGVKEAVTSPYVATLGHSLPWSIADDEDITLLAGFTPKLSVGDIISLTINGQSDTRTYEDGEVVWQSPDFPTGGLLSATNPIGTGDLTVKNQTERTINSISLTVNGNPVNIIG